MSNWQRRNIRVRYADEPAGATAVEKEEVAKKKKQVEKFLVECEDRDRETEKEVRSLDDVVRIPSTHIKIDIMKGVDQEDYKYYLPYLNCIQEVMQDARLVQFAAQMGGTSRWWEGGYRVADIERGCRPRDGGRRLPVLEMYMPGIWWTPYGREGSNYNGILNGMTLGGSNNGSFDSIGRAMYNWSAEYLHRLIGSRIGGGSTSSASELSKPQEWYRAGPRRKEELILATCTKEELLRIARELHSGRLVPVTYDIKAKSLARRWWKIISNMVKEGRIKCDDVTIGNVAIKKSVVMRGTGHNNGVWTREEERGIQEPTIVNKLEWEKYRKAKRQDLLATTKIIRGLGKDESLTRRKVKTVAVFRLGVGHLVYMDKSNRVVEIGVSPDSLTYLNNTLGRYSSSVVRIVGAGSLGLRAPIWGWYVSTRPDGQKGADIVVPDEHWDSMVWLMKDGYFLLPDVIEGEGIQDRATPHWNGYGGVMCLGNIPEMRRPTTRTQISASAARIRGAAACEAIFHQAAEIYVPRVAFMSRMCRMRDRMHLTMTGDKVDSRVVGNKLLQHLEVTMGVMCTDKDNILRWYIPRQVTANSWWWGRESGQKGGYTYSIIPLKTYYSSIEDITTKVWEVWPKPFAYGYKLKRDKEGVLKVSGPPLDGYRLWELAYKRDKIGIDFNGTLIDERTSTDPELKGERWLRRLEIDKVPIGPKVKDPDKIVDKLPDMPEEYRWKVQTLLSKESNGYCNPEDWMLPLEKLRKEEWEVPEIVAPKSDKVVEAQDVSGEDITRWFGVARIIPPGEGQGLAEGHQE